MECKVDKTLIAACGLYCGACQRYVKGKCPGCQSPQMKAEWCKLRDCCAEHKYVTCAECAEYGGVASKGLKECRKFNNFMGRVFGLIFGSDRCGCIDRIRDVGQDAFAIEMAASGCSNRPVNKQKNK